MNGKLDLRNCDCMDLMREFPDKHFELAIVDPPYGIGFAKTCTGKGWVVRDSKEWDSAAPDDEYFNQLFRVSQNQIIWGANYFSKNLPASMGWIFWDKGQRDFSLADGELAFSSFQRALRVFTFSRGQMQAEYGGKKISPDDQACRPLPLAPPQLRQTRRQDPRHPPG